MEDGRRPNLYQQPLQQVEYHEHPHKATQYLLIKNGSLTVIEDRVDRDQKLL